MRKDESTLSSIVEQNTPDVQRMLTEALSSAHPVSDDAGRIYSIYVHYIWASFRSKAAESYSWYMYQDDNVFPSGAQ